MYPKKCVAYLKTPTYDEIYQAAKKLIPSKDLPDKDMLPIICNYAVPRKVTCDINYNEWPAEIAKVIASVIPKESLLEIETKAVQGDPNAMLQLADCYFFGLKGMVSQVNSFFY